MHRKMSVVCSARGGGRGGQGQHRSAPGGTESTNIKAWPSGEGGKSMSGGGTKADTSGRARGQCRGGARPTWLHTT